METSSGLLRTLAFCGALSFIMPVAKYMSLPGRSVHRLQKGGHLVRPNLSIRLLAFPIRIKVGTSERE